MGQLEAKVALITGGAGGIGARTAEVLAEAGAVVVVTDIAEKAGGELAARIASRGLRASFLRLDVTREEDWQAAVERVSQEHGGLDVLFNNAGILSIGPIQALSLVEWRRVMSVNLDGVFLGTKHGIRAMTAGSTTRPQGGSIINMSSVAGITGTGFQAAYNSSKGGVRLLTKAAAHECGVLRNGVRVNSIHPAFIETPMVDAAWDQWIAMGYGRSREELRELFLSLHPIGRFGTPDDVAKAVLYLASDDSSFLTGSELIVDGGFSAV